MKKQTDIVVVGAGPLGIELAIQLKNNGFNYMQFEAGQIGQSITQWPPNTQFFSSPERVALAGESLHTPNQQSLTGEMYLAYLRELVESYQLKIHTFERVTDIEKKENGRFTILTSSGTRQQEISCRIVIIAIGNMNHPRQLDIPGVQSPFVHKRLHDPHTYFKKNVLVVGGKTSALEAALRAWRAGASVGISYRRSHFEKSIVKPHLSKEIELLIDKGKIRFYANTIPRRIEPGWTTLTHRESPTKKIRIPSDFVILGIGFTAETELYRRAGVTLIGQEERPHVNEETMETDVTGLYVCGTTASGTAATHELFISTCHNHVEKIMQNINGQVSTSLGAVPSRSYSVTFSDVKSD